MHHFPCEHSFFVCEIDFESYLLFTYHEVGKLICYPFPMPNQSVNCYVWCVWNIRSRVMILLLVSTWRTPVEGPHGLLPVLTHLATIDTRYQRCTEHNYNFNNNLVCDCRGYILHYLTTSEWNVALIVTEEKSFQNLHIAKFAIPNCCFIA